jgi:hypothetical protein
MMNDAVFTILGFIAVLIVLDVAALRYGVDSRGLTRELPLSGDAAVRMTPDIGRRLRASLTLESPGESPRARPEPARSLPLIESAPGRIGDAWRTTGNGWVLLWHPPVLRDGGA